MNHHEKQMAVLRFWFGEDPLKPLAHKRLWFSKNAAIDNQIRERFYDLLLDAGKGAFDDWTKTSDGALALVILLDQFPRNVFRGTDQAFAYDERALKAAQIAIAHDFDKKMNIFERGFLYLPFEHSERLEIQDRSVELYRTLYEEARTAEEQEFIREALEYAVRHRDIISEFGRFPHRNEILGRESTRQEIEFLKRPGAYF